jgi:hypothetical protein
MKTYGEVELLLHAFLMAALDWGEWSDPCLGHCTPGERAPSTYYIEGWAEPRAGLDAVTKKFPAPSRNQTLNVQPVS